MKRALAIFAIIAFASSFVACKKAYTCTLDDGSVVTTDYMSKKKKAAEDACATEQAAYGTGATCSI